MSPEKKNNKGLWMTIGVLSVTIIFLIFFKLPIEIPVVDEVIEEEFKAKDNMYMISHSEYWSGENGQIITRLLNYRSQPIIDANCTVDILYPDKTYFKQDEQATFNVDSYYYNFTTPSIEGVYEYKALCVYDSGVRNRSVMNSFHLSPALNFIQLSYDSLSSQIANLTDLNNAHFGNITYNLTQIKEDTQYIRDNLGENISFQQEVLDKLDSIANFCGDNVTSSSLLCLWVNETRNKVTEINTTMVGYLEEINATVHQVDDYIQNTIYPAIDEVESKLDEVLVNTTNIWDRLVLLDSNISQIRDGLDENKQLIIDINTSLVAEINVNEQKLDTLQANITTILNSIKDVVEPALINIENNISDMQVDLQTIIDNTDTLEDGQQHILSNISQLETDIDGLQSNITDIRTDIANLDTKVTAMNLTMVDRFDTLNSSVSSVISGINVIYSVLNCDNEYPPGNTIFEVVEGFNSSKPICDRLIDLQSTSGQINLTVNNIQNYMENNLTTLIISINGTALDNIPPTVEISIISPASVALGSNVDVNIQWIAIDGNLQNYYLNVTYPNGSLLVQTTSFDYDVTSTLLNTNGTYNVKAYAIDTYTNTNTASSTFTVTSGGVTISSIVIATPCIGNCQVNFTLVDTDSGSVDITGLDWTLLQGSFPIQNSSLYLTSLASSPGGIKHNITVDTTAELGNNIYPGVRIKITISTDNDYSNYFLVDNQNIPYDVWNYDGRYIHGELLN